jgi:hypothetical protein
MSLTSSVVINGLASETGSRMIAENLALGVAQNLGVDVRAHSIGVHGGMAMTG